MSAHDHDAPPPNSRSSVPAGDRTPIVGSPESSPVARTPHGRLSPSSRPIPRSYLANDVLAARQRVSLGWILVSVLAAIMGLAVAVLTFGVTMLWRWGLS